VKYVQNKQEKTFFASIGHKIPSLSWNVSTPLIPDRPNGYGACIKWATKSTWDVWATALVVLDPYLGNDDFVVNSYLAGAVCEK